MGRAERNFGGGGHDSEKENSKSNSIGEVHLLEVGFFVSVIVLTGRRIKWRLPMKEFLEFIIKYLVDKPDEVHINEISGERTVVFELRVGEGDMGKVIGRGGQTARSLRTLLAAASAKQGKRYVLEILEDKTE